MSAAEVARLIGRIHDAMWLPRIASWEIAQTDGVWGAHGELIADGSVAAVIALTKLASEVGGELADEGRLFTVDFTQRQVPVRVWWLRPVVPVVHATAPVLLTDLAQSEHELTGARLALWEEEQDTRRLRLAWKSARRGRAVARTRTAVLEAERHSTNEALDDTVAAIAEKNAQLADAEQSHLQPHERLILRFALELVDDAIANDSSGFTNEDTAALAKLRALSTGPTVAYRNPWRPGVLLCVEHGEGWAGMKPLSVEDLPNGGTCTAGDPADPDDVCGRDVLADADEQAEREFAVEAGHAPEAGDPDVVAYRSPQSGALYCVPCHAGGIPVTSEDLPDGGLCAACDVDVLITPAEAGESR